MQRAITADRRPRSGSDISSESTGISAGILAERWDFPNRVIGLPDPPGLRLRVEWPSPMRNAVVLALVGSLILPFAGCATSSAPSGSAEGSPTTSDGALLTLAGDSSGPSWQNWDPRTRERSTPERIGGVVRAFDYWEIDDGAVIDDIWSGLFPVLDGLRARSQSESQRKSAQLLLEAIEPDRGDRATRMDLTFLVSSSKANRFEGFACRLYRRLSGVDVTPAVTILFLRDPGQRASPDEIWVWGAPGFAEPDPITAFYRRDESGWKRAMVTGLSFPETGERPELSGGRAGKLVARVLTESIWNRFAGKAYLKSPNSGAKSDFANPNALPRALGLEVQDRSVRQVYSGTEFPPRANLDEL